jgi:hypothetical protein
MESENFYFTKISIFFNIYIIKFCFRWALEIFPVQLRRFNNEDVQKFQILHYEI